MKSVIITLSIIVVIVGGVLLPTLYIFGNFPGGYIEQEVREPKYSLETNYATFVWKDGIIAKAWFDPIDSVIAHPELPKQRHYQAEQFLKSIR